MTLDPTNWFTAAFPFAGGGGGAFGFKTARRSFRGLQAGYKILGGFDYWDYAANVFEYLVDAPCEVIDARVMTPPDLIRIFGPKAPRVWFTSPPCVAATKLVTNAKAAEPEYVEMNRLLLTNTYTHFEAWPEGSDFFLVENVPNVLAQKRGADMVREWCAFMRSKGYRLNVGTHNARHIGNLGQNRERLLIIARHEERVPVFVYKAPHQPGQTLGDVVGALPLPDDDAGGPMHGMTDGMSFRNRLRLWKIEAGKDWRSLIHDGKPERERFRRHLVSDPKVPCATIGGPGSNGPCAIADGEAPGKIGIDLAPERDRFPGSLGVQLPSEPSHCITGETATSNGRNAIADGRIPPRGVNLTLPMGTRHHVDRVTRWGEATGTVTCSPAPSSGCPAAADPRIPGQEVVLVPPSRQGPGRYDVFSKLGVSPWGEATRAVIGGQGSGACAGADPRVDLLMKIRERGPANHYQVCDPARPTPSVLCATRPGSGALSIAETRVPALLGVEDSPTRHRHVLGVQDPSRPSCCVTGEAKVTSGAFATAARVPVALNFEADNPKRHENKFAVVPFGRPARTVCATDSRVGSGAPVCADPRRPTTSEVSLALRATSGAWHEGAGPGRWGVMPAGASSSTVTANARHSTGPFSMADERPVPVDLVPKEKCYDKGYGVYGKHEVARTVAGCAYVGCGVYAMAAELPPDEPAVPDPSPCIAVRTRYQGARVGLGGSVVCDPSPAPAPVELVLGCAPHAGSYGVASFCAPSRCVIAYAKIDNSEGAVADPRPVPVPKYIVLTYDQVEAIVEGYVTVPFAIVDPARPDEPLAIVDDLDKPAYRPVVTYGKGRGGKRGKPKVRRLPVPVWMISRDGTCHRELTTLELAALQGFPVRHKGLPLDFGGGANKQRRVVGNAVPAPVAEAIAEQILLSLIASTVCSFMLAPGDWDVWVQSLIAEGFTVVPSDRVFDFATGLLDDGAPRPPGRVSGKGRKVGKIGRARQAMIEILTSGASSTTASAVD